MILKLAECGRLIATDKQNEEGQWTLVLHCACRNYSVFVYRKTACQNNAFGSSTCTDTQILQNSTFSDVIMCDLEEIPSTERVSAH